VPGVPEADNQLVAVDKLTTFVQLIDKMLRKTGVKGKEKG
jgi:hypothetical protein